MFLIAVSIVFGLIIGSFLNVVIFRLHGGRSLGGRSFCAHCAHTLRWYDLVPVFSYVALRGRCRYCHSRISWQYPLVELAVGVTFALIAFPFRHVVLEPLDFVFLASRFISFSLFIAIFVYDLRHKIIPDVLVYPLALTALIPVLVTGFMQGFSSETLSAVIAGPILFTPFFLLWFLSRGKWMGFGDAKLAIGMGWLLSIEGGLSAVIFGFWSGAVVGVALISRTRLVHGANSHVSMKSEVPFAPFLIAGVYAVEFFHFSILSLGL